MTKKQPDLDERITRVSDVTAAILALLEEQQRALAEIVAGKMPDARESVKVAEMHLQGIWDMMKPWGPPAE